jgi:hypothetical protein
MLIHPTVERLRALGLTAMADAFIELQNSPDAGELSREDWLGLLVDREATSRENKRLARRLREARLRQAAVVEDVDYVRIAVSTAPCFRSSPPAIGFASITIWSSSAQPVSASRGSLVPSATRPVATASRCSTSALRACSPISPRRAVKVGCRGC